MIDIIVGLSAYILIGIMRMYLIFVVGFTLKKKGWPKIIVAPIFIFGFIYDIFLNYLLTVPFLDPPKKLDETITYRLKRYKKLSGYRYNFAVWMCSKLNKYDENHC